MAIAVALIVPIAAVTVSAVTYVIVSWHMEQDLLTVLEMQLLALHDLLEKGYSKLLCEPLSQGSGEIPPEVLYLECSRCMLVDMLATLSQGSCRSLPYSAYAYSLLIVEPRSL